VQDTGFGLWSSKGRGYRKDGVDAEEDDRWFHVGFLFGLSESCVVVVLQQGRDNDSQ
jgi:hypothetical protein